MKLLLLAISVFTLLQTKILYADIKIEEEVLRINSLAKAQKLPLKELTQVELLHWFRDYLNYGFLKEDRVKIIKGLQKGVLVSPYTLDIQTFEEELHIEPRIALLPPNLNYTVVEGQKIWFYTEFARISCNPKSLCEESFQGKLPEMQAKAFPTTVPLQISESKAAGNCLVGSNCIFDVLTIRILVTKTNLSQIVDYFAHGFSESFLKSRLEQGLGPNTEKWIDLKDIFPSWLGDKVNTFPADGDNEVCHGPARQFFNPILSNSHSQDRSTEPVAILLKDYYCKMGENDEPGFGDYLYVPGRHSGRYLLKDPKTGRWIVFSVQSGGASAFRFWWADEDFSGAPFSHKPLSTFKERFVDVWRRCK